MSPVEALSRNGAAIRLTDERWQHIIEEHPELADAREEVLAAISNAEQVLQGAAGELLAVRMIGTGKAIVVVYRELDGKGFIITAFVTRRLKSLERRVQIWPSQM